ncbi:MAG: hypothetical protein DBX58_08170 [Clostridiales bacterium]|nr:MAG: hypothetical protein DBX58_08170 [Clostridiales bacterium]
MWTKGLPQLRRPFLYDRKFHSLSYKKRRSAEDAHFFYLFVSRAFSALDGRAQTGDNGRELKEEQDGQEESG